MHRPSFRDDTHAMFHARATRMPLPATAIRSRNSFASVQGKHQLLGTR